MKKGPRLLLLMALLLIGCNSTVTETAEHTDVNDADTTVLTETETAEPDIFADVDFEGQTVSILTWATEVPHEYFSEDGMTGDIVNDAVWERNNTVEEALNVSLEFFQPTAGNISDNKYKKLLQSSIFAGDYAYDLVSAHSVTFGSCLTAGLLTDLSSVPYIDLDSVWYNQTAVDSLTIYGKTYGVAGDISHSSIVKISTLFVNLDMMEDFDLGDIFGLVLDKTWTLDKMHSMTKAVTSDLDGDGAYTANDRYGVISLYNQLPCLYYASGFRFLEHSADGGISISSDYASERCISVLDKWISIFGDSSKNSFDLDESTTIRIFLEGRALFNNYPLDLCGMDITRSSDIAFGIVPVPMVDESVGEYHACLSNTVTLWGIPSLYENDELSGAVMECMSREGYRTVYPAVFETCYKVKYTRDGSGRESKVMDILHDGAVIDLGRICSVSLYNIPGEVFMEIRTRNNTLTSSAASYNDKLNASLDKILSKLSEALE